MELKPIEKVLSKFKDDKLKSIKEPKYGERQWITFCPAHNDVNNPNLQITELKDGKVLLRCFSKNCSASHDDILDALGLQLTDLNPTKRSSAILKLLAAYQNVQTTEDPNVWTADCSYCKGQDRFHVLKLRITEFPDKKKGCWIICGNSCDLANILMSAGLNTSDLNIKARRKAKAPKGKWVATHNYYKGDFLHHQVVRIVQPNGEKITPVRHLGANNKLEWGEGNKEKVLYNYNDVLQSKGYGNTVHFTEGEKNADKLKSLGYVSTANLGGSGRWREIKDWIQLCGEKIVLYQDNDESGEVFANELASFLSEKTDDVRVITPPMLGLKEEHEDISDWFEKYNGTKTELDAIIDKCPKFDILAAYLAGMKKGDLPDILPANYNDAAAIVEKINYLYKTTTLIREDIIGFVNWQNAPWAYNGRCYRNRLKYVIKSRIWKTAAACKTLVKSKKPIDIFNIGSGSEVVPYFIDKKKQEELYNALMSRNLLELPEDATLPYWINGQKGRPEGKNIIVVRNGYLDISDLEHISRQKSTAELFSPSYINVDIDPDDPPEYPTLWFQWLKEWLHDDDAIRESQKWSGYSLISNFLYKAALCCLGHGDSGKTTWLYHFTCMLAGSMLSIDCDRFGSPYGLARAPGKLVIAVDDASWAISKQNYGTFKTNLKNISGGTPATIRQMHNAPFDMLLFAKLIFATDDPPRFADPGGQFATRWRYLRFLFDLEYYTKQKKMVYTPEEHRKLIREMKEGIFWWYSLPGLKMLEDDRGFINPKNTMDIIEEVEFASRPYLAFFKVVCERDEAQIGWTAETGLVYDKWKMFCEANDLMDMHSYSDHKTFTREFKRYIKRIKVKEHIFYGFRLRKGVELKSDVAQIG